MNIYSTPMSVVVQKDHRYILASIRRDIIHNDITPSPLEREVFAASISQRYGVIPSSVPAYKARLSIAARDVMRAHNIDEKFELDLKVLSLQYVNAAESNSDATAFRQSLTSAAKRIEITPKLLFKAVDAFSRLLIRENSSQYKVNFEPAINRPVKEAFSTLSSAQKLELRKEILTCLTPTQGAADDNINKTIADKFNIGERRVVATRSWVEKIFMHQAKKEAQVEIAESSYPAVLVLANNAINHSELGHDELGLDSDKIKAQIDSIAPEIGISNDNLIKVIKNYLKNLWSLW
jgi:uncharacterized protein YggU (UPF0235/DUF167 family)